MADSSSVGIFVTIFVAIGSMFGGTVVTLLKFWSKLTDKIADTDQKAGRAEMKADGATQEAAEAKNEVANLREAQDHMIRDFHDQSDRALRETGESNAAIRTKITEVELYIRDRFMEKTDFKDAMDDIKAVQLRMNTKLDDIARDLRVGHGRR